MRAVDRDADPAFCDVNAAEELTRAVNTAAVFMVATEEDKGVAMEHSKEVVAAVTEVVVVTEEVHRHPPATTVEEHLATGDHLLVLLGLIDLFAISDWSRHFAPPPLSHRHRAIGFELKMLPPVIDPKMDASIYLQPHNQLMVA